MKRILVPIDGSSRSLIAVEEVKKGFSPRVFEVALLMVYEDIHNDDINSNPAVVAEFKKKLEIMENYLKDYSVIKKISAGKAGTKIVECARELDASMIVMMPSTKTEFSNTVGRTASYVLSHATCNVLIVHGKGHNRKEAYRGLVYNKPAGAVTLRGLLSDKQSECQLPSVRGNVIYHITVTRGSVRFQHKSYNEGTGDWDLSPLNGQREYYEVMQGETMSIPVNSENETGKLDRIRIINKSVKSEAVFSYKITKEG